VPPANWRVQRTRALRFAGFRSPLMREPLGGIGALPKTKRCMANGVTGRNRSAGIIGG
jgi:hypothetical protein